jgi:hypothetical protein
MSERGTFAWRRTLTQVARMFVGSAPSRAAMLFRARVVASSTET